MKKKKPPLKRFIVSKRIMAADAAEALRLEKKHKAEEVQLDTDYKPEHVPADMIGFRVETESDTWK